MDKRTAYGLFLGRVAFITIALLGIVGFQSDNETQKPSALQRVEVQGNLNQKNIVISRVSNEVSIEKQKKEERKIIALKKQEEEAQLKLQDQQRQDHIALASRGQVTPIKASSANANNASQWMDFVATWYTQGEGSGITSTGTHVSSRTIAVDPNVIPLGSKIEILYPDGRTETRIAEDTGGAIKGNIVDIFCYSRSEAIRNGKQVIKIRIVR